jgi:hypothetical protein
MRSVEMPPDLSSASSGPGPRPLVSLSLERRTPAEAGLGILEGLGLNYVLQFDATLTRVQTLMMTGTAWAGAATRSSAPTPAHRAVPPLSSADQEQEPVDEEDDPEPPVQRPPPNVPPPGPVPVPAPAVPVPQPSASPSSEPR